MFAYPPQLLTTSNMLTLLQNVAVLGILGLAMAIVVIGRGIDISLIAALAVPPGLVLQMVQDGRSLPTSLAAAFALTVGFGLVNGWLIAYASTIAVHHAGVGVVSRRSRSGRAVQARRGAVELGARRIREAWTGQSVRHTDADRDVRAVLRRGSILSAADAARRLYLRDRRQSQRRAGHGHPDPSHHRTAICARGANRLRGGPHLGRLGRRRARRASSIQP